MGRLGVHNIWGPGSDFQIDSTKPVQVTTQFITDDGSDSGKLTEVKQFYTQDGKTIEHPLYNVNGNTYSDISDDYCNDWVATTKDSTPPPTPTPTPGDCPGGSLIACIDLCPSDVFAACSESCKHRCASVVLV